jgi:HAD superfamily hydrolase (TIGR01549 family)
MSRSAIIFDLDGTLTKPRLDFDAIRAELGVSGPILEAMEQMTPAQRAYADRVLIEHEWQAAREAELQDDAGAVIDQLRRSGWAIAILTRNARATLDHVLERFGLVVDTVRTREDGAVKPSPEPVLSICEELRADPRQSWMVGDFLFDILSGRAAGTRTALMIGDQAVPDFADQADVVIRRLRELVDIVLMDHFGSGGAD